MTKDDETREARSRRPRKKAVHYAKRRSLRFSVEEEEAVESVRRALAATRGRDVEDVTFSEALRLLVLDKESAAEVEARAAVLERSGSAVVSSSQGSHGGHDVVPQEVLDLLSELRLEASRIGSNVNQIARRVNAGDAATATEIAAGLQGAASLKASCMRFEAELYARAGM